MKVLLVRPPYSRLRGTGQIPYFPLGIGYVAASLEKNGIESAIYHIDVLRSSNKSPILDERVVFDLRSRAQTNYMNSIADDNHEVWNEVRETLAMYNPDMLGVSLMTVEYPAALKVSRIAREFNPAIKIVWGGFHATSMPESSLANDEVDIVVAGEGEVTTVNLCKALESGGDLDKVTGLYLKKPDGTVYSTGHTPIIENLDDIPHPARHLRLYPESWEPLYLSSLVTSRGCPFRCTFCGARNLWEKKFRQRSPENVVEEIRSLVENHKTNHIMFFDDTFSLKKSYGMAMCKAISESKLNVVWTTGTRVDKVDEELLAAMKEAGCVYIDLGIETGSERMSKIIKKDITKEMVHKAVGMINRSGIASSAFFMAGFLEETYDDLQDTLDMIKAIDTTHISLNVWDPMPGSDLFDQAVELGVVAKDQDFADFPLWPDRHFAARMDPEIFTERCNEVAAYVYDYNMSFRAYYRKVRPKVLTLLRRDPGYLAYRIAGRMREWVKSKRSRNCNN